MIDPRMLDIAFQKRPFKTRNADEIKPISILSLFVDPTDGLNRPFDYENIIIKGKMGTGKTMYLKANLAYYKYTLVPSLLQNELTILPIYIKLSDFQSIHDNDEIYESIILKILKGMLNAYQDYISAEALRSIHMGFRNLSPEFFVSGENVNRISMYLRQLSADEYVENVMTKHDFGGSVKSKILDAFISKSKQFDYHITERKKPKYEDIDTIYEKLLAPFNIQLLFLLDEVGSLNSGFFKGNNDDSLFETLMNQFRTAEYIRTKIAVYPDSPSDILTETRYGDVIELEDNLLDNQGYKRFYNRSISLIEKYLKESTDNNIMVEDLFDITRDNNYALDQLIYASSGNTRRFVYLIDMAMNTSYIRANGKSKITADDVNSTLKEHGEKMENLFSYSEKCFIQDLVNVCKSRGAFRFKFPSKSSSIMRLANKSSEYNAINILENGIGRKGTIYMFDYAFCVYKDIPTHFISGTEKLDKTRNIQSSQIIKKVTVITDSLMAQAILPGKIEGEINFLNENRDSGFVKSDDGTECFFTESEIISEDKHKKLTSGKRLRYIPIKFDDYILACEIEIL